MTIANTLAQDRALLVGWVDFGDGVHVTRSSEIIQQALHVIQQRHIFCTVVAKGYESGKVVIVKFGSGRLILDRPPDWPPQMRPQPLRIVFKDQTQLWNHFVVGLIEVTTDSLITSMPHKYISLQRRNYYRVAVPQGSRAEFYYQGELIAQCEVENISASGALLRFRGKLQQFTGGEVLTAITMFFPGDRGEKIQVKVREGRVVRICENERRDFCFGLHFSFQASEERDLLRYVRLCERNLLRRGLID